MIGAKKQINYRLVVLSFILAFVASVIPMPAVISFLKPEWVILVLIFWCLYYPDKISVGTAWTLGLLQDSLRGVLLGQNAFCYALVAYFTIQLHQRLKLFPFLQQALMVMLLIAMSQICSLWIQGIIGNSVNSTHHLLSVLSTTLFWPIVYFLLQELSNKKILMA